MDIYFYSKEKAINSIDVTIDEKHLFKLKNLNKSITVNPRKSILISSQNKTTWFFARFNYTFYI